MHSIDIGTVQALPAGPPLAASGQLLAGAAGGLWVFVFVGFVEI